MITGIEGPGALWDAVYRDLLRVSFPDDELGDSAGLAALLASGEARASAIVDGGRPLAVAFGEWSASTRIQLLAYLAVVPELRGRGLGGQLLDAVVADWRQRYDPCAILAEIEHPAWHEPDAAHGDPVARMRFYARHGGVALDVPYFQPALGEGRRRCYGMVLIALHIAPQLRGSAPGTIDAGAVGGFLRGYFAETEGIPEDAAGRALLAAASVPAGVPILELTDGVPTGSA